MKRGRIEEEDEMFGDNLVIAFVVAANVLLIAAWVYLYRDWCESS